MYITDSKQDSKQVITNLSEILPFPVFREGRITEVKNQIQIQTKELRALLVEYKKLSSSLKTAKEAEKVYNNVSKLSNNLIAMHFELERGGQVNEINNDLVA
jgi:hypothetical protein